MKGQNRLLTCSWMPVGVAVLIAGHGMILYYVSSHVALSAAVVSGVIVLVIKHLGLLPVLLGPLYALFRKRSKNRK